MHVFNVEGILVSNSPGISFPGIGATVADFQMPNADGYTGYLDSSLDTIYTTEATIHPYITFFDDYSLGNFDASNPMGFDNVTIPGPSGNLVMPMGSDYNEQSFTLDIQGQMNFIFALSCTYGISAESKSQRFTPEYKVPQFNKKAASEISVEIITNDLKGGQPLSSANLEIHVVDISHGVPVGMNLDEMFSDSSIGNITIDIPGVLLSPTLIAGSTGVGGGHDPSDPVVFSTTISNENSADEGTYNGLIMVADTYPPAQNQSLLLGGSDGIQRVDPVETPLNGLFSIIEFVTYQFFSIDVASGCGPISGSITSPACPVTGVANNGTLSFSVTASSANGGDPIALYEIDYDYDGITFNMDDSNTDGIFGGVGPFIVPAPCVDNIPHDFTVAFRATDSCPTPNQTIFATCVVTVDSCVQWKNIALRTDSAAKDLAVRPTGELLIVYDDGQVWEYNEVDYFSHTTATNLFTAEVVQWSALTPPPSPVLANAYIEVSDAGYIFTSNATGAICNYPVGYWPAQTFSSTGSPLGSGPSHCTGGPIQDVYCYKSGSGGFNLHHVLIAPSESGSQSNMYRSYYLSWSWAQQYGQECYGPGYDQVVGIDIVGTESASVNQFWALEDSPDYFGARFIQDTFFYYHYSNAYFGTGTQTEADSCWNEAKDLTADSDGNLYVLDQMLDGTGRVKGFTGSVTGGTSLGHFDVPDNIDSTPLRIEGSEVSGPNGNLIFVLHGDYATSGCYLSVFLPSEVPW